MLNCKKCLKGEWRLSLVTKNLNSNSNFVINLLEDCGQTEEEMKIQRSHIAGHSLMLPNGEKIFRFGSRGSFLGAITYKGKRIYAADILATTRCLNGQFNWKSSHQIHFSCMQAIELMQSILDNLYADRKIKLSHSYEMLSERHSSECSHEKHYADELVPTRLNYYPKSMKLEVEFAPEIKATGVRFTDERLFAMKDDFVLSVLDLPMRIESGIFYFKGPRLIVEANVIETLEP